MNLKELRASRGYQRKFVVSKIGISSKHLNDIEAGRVNLTEKVAKKLADFYEADLEDIKIMYKESTYEEKGCSEKAKESA